jgi:hypothetical protein
MAMNREWILQTREARRTFANATWVPLRAYRKETFSQAHVTEVGYVSEVFACGSVAFPPEHREVAEQLGWTDLGVDHAAQPYAYADGHYSPIDQFQYNDKEAIGVELVFEYEQPVAGGTKWILNPDLVVALRLVKEGNNWVRPEEDFVVVVRQTLDEDGNHQLIEIKREFLLDYLAARGLALRLSYYLQRVENVTAPEGTEYEGLKSQKVELQGGRYELLIRSLENVFGGGWAAFRAWRTDVDEEEDAPVMGSESDENTDYEKTEGSHRGYDGVRVEGEFWREEWIDHLGQSVRVRRDTDQSLPQFIIETDGSRAPSLSLKNEEVGRWLWFRSAVVTEFIGHRGFALKWYSADTGAILSTSGNAVHFGINSSDLVTVYAYDIAILPGWEQHLWAACNVVPDGKVSGELLAAQVRTQPASTHAVEELFIVGMRMLERGFREKYGIALFTHDIDDEAAMQQVTRFLSQDRASLLRLAKEIIRVFADRLNVRELSRVSTHTDRDKLGSIKLLQDVLAKEAGEEKAREVIGPIVGAYDMRIGDAHPAGSKVEAALELAGIDENYSHLRQGKQLIDNVSRALWHVGKLLFGQPEAP